MTDSSVRAWPNKHCIHSHTRSACHDSSCYKFYNGMDSGHNLPSSRDSSIWQNSPTVIVRPVLPLSYWSHFTLSATPRAVIDSACRQTWMSSSNTPLFTNALKTNDAMTGWISSSPGLVLLLKCMDREVCVNYLRICLSLASGITPLLHTVTH